MSPIVYISLFLSLLAAICLAEVISLRSSDSQAVARRAPPIQYRPVVPLASAANDLTNDYELLDIVLLASVDGKFHGLNRTSGQTLWSMSSVPPSTSTSATSASASTSLGPLVRTTHIDHDLDLTDDNMHHETYIIEPQSGDIYVMASPTSPLQRFPFSVAELVDMSPFSFSGDEERRVFVGRKETTLLVIELETGRVKATVNTECPWDPFEDLRDDEEEVDLDELEGSKPPVPARTEVYIGRTDYHISIITRPHVRGRSVPTQNLVFSTYGPNNQDNALQASYRRTKDNSYIQSLPNGEVIAFKANQNEEVSSSSNSHLLWAQQFPTPVVAVFDVLRNTTQHKPPFVLLQPRPRLQDVIPNLSQLAAENLSKLESAYVGMVEETGSLFAMSPDRYPLVVFGSNERYEKDRLIDAPEEDDGYIPTAVDEITRARKLRERAEKLELERCIDNINDRRCLVGIRRLESGDAESRISRLLEGPVDGRFPALRTGDGSQKLEDVVALNESMPSSLDNAVHGLPDPQVRSMGWLKPGGVWEAMVVTFVLGILSVVFAVKKFGRTKTGKLIEREKQKADTPHTPEVLMKDTEPVSETAGLDSTVDSLTGRPPPLDLSKSKEFTTEDHLNTTVPPSTPPEEGDEEGDDAEGEGDVSATLGKRKGRRGKRGRKKKVSIVALAGEDVEDEKETAAAAANGNANIKEAIPTPPPSSLVITSSSPKPPAAVPSLIVDEKTILGYGSHGTVVFQGSLQGRAVAVKRLLQDFVTLASREVSILQESDDHPNVIRYYYQEAHLNFLYIALELCPCSLADVIESPHNDKWSKIVEKFDPKKALKQITSGLRHLHALKLVHRDIKPQNILVSSSKTVNGQTGYRMLISDFGLCKRLDVDQTSFLPTTHGAMAAGTVGWRAPEILRGDVKLDDVDDHSLSSRGSVSSVATVSGGSTPSTAKPTRLTKSVDIFALGCLFYYTMTGGSHPYGGKFERDVNIIKNEKNLDGLEKFEEEGTEAVDLINSMLDPTASERPDTTACLLHPFFWDAGRRLNFLQDASDRFEIMCRDPKEPDLLALEKGASNVVGHDWVSRLDKILIENLGKFRKYDGKSVQDLLRALRNKKNHYQDLPDHVKRHLGPMPEGYLSYFTRRYPRLFLHVHSVIGDTGLRNESMFRTYFELPDS